MKASKLIKGMVSAALLSSLFAGGAAWAEHGYAPAPFGGFEGDGPGYRHFEPEARYQYRQYDGRVGQQIDHRQAAQWERIRHGIRSGELTHREAARLMAEQREIERLQQIYMADGRLNRHERRRLTAELDDASQHIWREVRDDQDRYGRHQAW